MCAPINDYIQFISPTAVSLVWIDCVLGSNASLFSSIPSIVRPSLHTERILINSRDREYCYWPKKCDCTVVLIDGVPGDCHCHSTLKSAVAQKS